MELKGKNIGYCFTGSFCTFKVSIIEMKKLVEEGANVFPIMSFNAYHLDTKFGKADDFIKEIEKITGNKIIHSIQAAEPIGPKKMFDILIIAPCTGNTIAKLANDIIDTPVTMATKSHLRTERPVVIAISTNNALSGAAENIGKLLNRKHYYFVPFKQDNPILKPRSIVADFSYVKKTLEYALDKEQIQPIIL
ncbi:MAG: dipicolinate synthase subunit B [Clostridia bacterium]|nr:dipicolinate synthase subunit B [Clostridia bacterium]